MAKKPDKIKPMGKNDSNETEAVFEVNLSPVKEKPVKAPKLPKTKKKKKEPAEEEMIFEVMLDTQENSSRTVDSPEEETAEFEMNMRNEKKAERKAKKAEKKNK